MSFLRDQRKIRKKNIEMIDRQFAKRLELDRELRKQCYA